MKMNVFRGAPASKLEIRKSKLALRKVTPLICPTRTDYRKAIALVHPLPNFGSDLRLRRLICGKRRAFRKAGRLAALTNRVGCQWTALGSCYPTIAPADGN